MSNAIFKNKKLNLEKLLQFGFFVDNGKYTYTTKLANGQFKMIVNILNNGTVHTKVTDSSSYEEYVLHYTSEACGSFVGMCSDLRDSGPMFRERMNGFQEGLSI